MTLALVDISRAFFPPQRTDALHASLAEAMSTITRMSAARTTADMFLSLAKVQYEEAKQALAFVKHYRRGDTKAIALASIANKRRLVTLYLQRAKEAETFHV